MAFIGVYRALYDYAPQSEEELEIHDGDMLFVLEKSNEDDWWKCKKKAASEDDDEPEGLVPNTYVEEVKPTHSAKALYDYTKQTDEELSFTEGTRLDVYDTTDPDWTLVGSNGDYGFVPAIYIEQISADASAATAPAPPAMPARPTASDEPLPGEADYVPPGASASNPARDLAAVLSQKTGGASEAAPSTQRALAAPPPMAPRPQYTPEESEEDEAPPMPQRPPSQSIASPQSPPSPVRPARSESQYIPSGTAEAGGIFPSPPSSARTPTFEDYDGPRSPSGYRMYNIHEVVSHMGKSKKLPMTLGINIQKGIIRISPDKSKDGESKEWTADKLEHYSIEGKHVFVELVRPSRSVDFHAGAKETAQEIVAHLGEVAGASRAIGLSEVLAASAGTGSGGLKTGKMYYEFLAQGDDEVTVAQGDEVIILDDVKSDEWWMVRRLKNGKEGVVPSSYVEITGTVPTGSESMSGLNAARSTVEQNRLEEERLAKEAAKSGSKIPERGSSLSSEPSSSKSRSGSKRSSRDANGAPKSKPNPSRVRTWTDRTGSFKVEAEFIGLREGKIHLHKMNGVKIAVPVAKMSVEDLEYVEKATGASLDEDKPLSDIKRRSTQRAKTNGAGATIVPKDHEYWFDFFLQAGVNPQICERYASAFSRDQMSPEVLPDVNEQLLRTLGLKEGDILRVMKFLDNKFDRKRTIIGGAAAGPGDDPDKIEQAGRGGLFSGPGGALRNNTRKARPAPAVQTSDVISDDAFKPAPTSTKTNTEGAQKTILASAPTREPQSGFDDDAWDVKPARTQTPEAPKIEEPPKPVEPPRPKVNDDIASLSILSPPLQPTPVPAPAPAPVQSPPVPEQPSKPQGADAAIFEKIANLAPARQRPQPPPQVQQTGASLGVPPPPRAASAPGFQPQQNAFGNVAPLQAQLTGYQPQFQQPLQPQQTAFQAPQGYGGYPGQNGIQNGFVPQQTSIQAMQQNYPALQPQPTGMAFQPQSSFGQQQQSQFYGGPTYQQQLVNGAQTGSPFADPPRAPYQPSAPSGLQNSFVPTQPTGFQSQPTFNTAAPTGMNGLGSQPIGAPQLPPQQTGGVFGPSQPLAPLVPQKTGPPPPVRFGVKPGEKKLVPQQTGRANLAKATPQNPFGF